MPRVWDLILELAEYERLLDKVEGSLESLTDGLGKHFHCKVLEQEGQIIGYCLYFYNYSTFMTKPGLYIEDIYVQPSHRGAGLGRHMLEALAAEANAKGCGRMEWSVLDWNTPAIGFYEKMGAQVHPEWNLCRLTGDGLKQYAPVG